MANRPERLAQASLVEDYGPPGEVASLVRKRRLALPFHLVEPVVFAVDFCLMVGVSVLSGIAYSRAIDGGLGDVRSFLSIGVLTAVYCAALLAARGDYRIKHLVHVRKQMREVTFAWFSIFFILMSVAFSLKIAQTFSRGATLTYFGAGWLSLLAWRGYVAAYLAHSLANGGFAERKVILIGQQSQLSSSGVLSELRRCGYKPIHTIVITEREIAASGMATSLRDSLGNVIETTRYEDVEGIFLLIDWNRKHCIENILMFLSVLPIPVHLMPDQNVSKFLSYPVTHIGATWTAELRRAPLAKWECALKRSLDVIVAGTALIALSPLMLMVAALIRLDSPGPVLFRQTRNGFNGKSFPIFKFRTMKVLEDGPIIRQATQNDPRVTRAGKLMRRTNLDELPQLFNVLRGDMSLIGPRPHAAAQNGEYEQRIATYAYRYHVKPGMSGWAQVNGYRGETRTVDLMQKRVEHDLWYINNWSIWLDIRILLRTLVVGLQSSAY